MTDTKSQEPEELNAAPHWLPQEALERPLLPVADWQWLADQLRAWPEKRVHPERTMCDGVLRPMAAKVIEEALRRLSAITPQPNTEGWQYVPKEPTAAMRHAFENTRPANAVETEEGEWVAPYVDWFNARYIAMLTAAPAPPEEGA